jgi:hypothetical protein
MGKTIVEPGNEGCQKPDSMSLEEAEGLIAEYLKPEIYEGEWKFEGEIK